MSSIDALDVTGFIGGMCAILMFIFTASRGNRLLLDYLKERAALAAVQRASTTQNGKRSNRDGAAGSSSSIMVHPWYDDTRLMFYSLTILSAVSYATTTLAQLMAPESSSLRKNSIESDAMSLANVATYLSMVSSVVWTIAHGIMLEWRRTHSVMAIAAAHHHGGRMVSGAAGAANHHHASSRTQRDRDKINSSTAQPVVSGSNTVGGDTRSSMGKGYNNMYSSSNANEDSIDGGDDDSAFKSSAAGIDDVYFEDDDDDRSYPNMNQQQQQQPQPQLLPAGDYSGTSGAAATADGVSNVTSFSQGYSSTHLANGQRGSNLSESEIGRNNSSSSNAVGNRTNANNQSGGRSGNEVCCGTENLVHRLFPYRLIISIVVVAIYYVTITGLTERKLVSGANFSAGLSFLIGLICGILAIGSSLYLCERGAVVAARRFGLALTVLFVCLIARGVAVMDVVQENVSASLSPMVIPLIDSFSILCVIVVLPSKKFCLCMDLN